MTKYDYIKQDNRNSIVPVILMALMGLLCIIIYSNSIHSSFIFDDHQYITDDPAIRVTRITPANLINAMVNGRPKHRLLPNLSFAFNYYFGRYRVAGYHMVNIAIHLFTGIFLFLFFRTTLNLCSDSEATPPCGHDSGLINTPTGIAFLAACLWLAHPVQTQAVTYIVQRMTSIAAMFYILSLLLYALGRKRMRRSQNNGKTTALFTGSLAAGLCALASKENTATLPVMILIYEWFFFQGLKRHGSKKQLLCAVGVLALFCMAALVYLGNNPFHRIVSSYAFRDYTLPQRVMTEFRVMIYYISLFFYPRPARLTLDYDYPLSVTMLTPITTLFSFLAIIVLLGLSVYLARKKSLLASFCILWFFITLIIESSVISIEIIYEHRMYLASMMPVLLATSLLFDTLRSKRFAVFLICGIIALCGVWTYQRNEIWKNPVTFWEDNLQKFPEDSRVLNNLGSALMNAGQTDRAIGYFKKSIALKASAKTPRADIIDPINNLATALFRKQEYNRAIETLKTAIRINPTNALSHINIAIAFQAIGQYDKAMAHYKRAEKINPRSTKTLNGLGSLCLKQGNSDQALIYFQNSLLYDPENTPACANMARAFTEKGDLDQAIYFYSRALKMDKENGALLVALGNVYARKKAFSTAAGLYEKALRLNPENTDAAFALALAHAMQKDYKNAIRAFQQILAYTPENPNIYYNIACMNALRNNAYDAVSWLRKAVKHGYKNLEHLTADPDLNNIRTTKRYRDFIDSVMKHSGQKKDLP